MNFIQWQKAKLGVALDADEPKSETLAEHRKHCKAEKGDCPFEKEEDKMDVVKQEGDDLVYDVELKKKALGFPARSL